MRLFILWLIASGLLLLIVAVGFIAGFVPMRWRLSLLAVIAMLITTLPAGAQPESRPTCYDMAMPLTPEQIIKQSEAWAAYRAAYLPMLQYFINNPSRETGADKSVFNTLHQNLRLAEDKLNEMVMNENLPSKLISAITEGMNYYTMDYDRAISGVECYKPMVNPELTRHFALSNIVARQVELQKLISQKADISEQTLNMIKEDMRTSVTTVLDKADVALYMNLMMDLLNYLPDTSKVYCYK